MPAFQRGRGAAQDDGARFALRAQDGNVTRMVARRLVLLVRAFVLLIDNDNSEPVDGRKHGASGSNNDARRTGMDLVPFVVAFACREMAVENRHFTLDAREARFEPLDGLRSEGNLRHKYERGAAEAHCMPDSLKINFRLTASRYAKQQQRADGSLDCLLEGFYREALFCIQNQIVRRQERLTGERIASYVLRFDSHPAVAFKSPKNRLTYPGLLREFSDGTRTAGLLNGAQCVGLAWRLAGQCRYFFF
jgi:hypothetical protein